jgi:carboxypeptidase Taq
MESNKFIDLKARLMEINDLEAAGALLYWDQATHMPPGGAAARGAPAWDPQKDCP